MCTRVASSKCERKSQYAWHNRSADISMQRKKILRLWNLVCYRIWISCKAAKWLDETQNKFEEFALQNTRFKIETVQDLSNEKTIASDIMVNCKKNSSRVRAFHQAMFFFCDEREISSCWNYTLHKNGCI